MIVQYVLGTADLTALSQFRLIFCFNYVVMTQQQSLVVYISVFKVFTDLQIIDTFQDSVMSLCLTQSEILAGSVDGTVRTFDIRLGR